MAVEWKREFEIGVWEIDGQHRELFTRLEHLLEAIDEGRGTAAVGETLNFLTRYTQQHFQDEEELQKLYKYPHAAMHHNEHQYFIDNLADIRKRIETEGVSGPLVKRTSYALQSWLINHICVTDKELAGHIARHPLI